MKRLVNFFAAMASICVLGLGLMPPSAVSADNAQTTTPSGHVVINEIKLGGNSNQNIPTEYVTLFNTGDTAAVLNGWKLEYAKASATVTCTSPNWNVPPSQITTLSGTLQPDQLSSPITRSLTDNTSGSLQLVDTNGVVQDLVGWGSAAACSETAATQIPANDKSIQRYVGCSDGFPADTNNNAADFTAGITPNPTGLSGQYAATCQTSNQTVTGNDVVPIPPPTADVGPLCEGVLISELLPNPGGSDTGHEFIELYNPTASTISLDGCALQTSANSKTYSFSGVSLASGAYVAFYDNQTGLTLPNSSGGTVWLLTPTEELQAITYPANMPDDVAWARFGDTWQATYDPTPNAPNILESSMPCPDGQYRNDTTGRCDTLFTAETLAPCQPDQVRSPITNRCRSNLATVSPQPCPAGKSRNPATNRCVSADGSSTLTPCQPGQERNPATNRCRSVGASTGALKPCQSG